MNIIFRWPASPHLILLVKTKKRQNSNFTTQWNYKTSCSNWTFLFLGRDELETIFNTASKNKKSLREKEKKQKTEKCEFIAISQAHEIKH